MDYALESNPISRNVQSYCQSLIACAEARAVMTRALAVIKECHAYAGDIAPVRQCAEQVIDAVASRTGLLETADLGTALDKYVDDLFNPAKSPKIKTYLGALDAKLNGGLAIGTLTMVGGRRGGGKTAVGLHIVNEALKQGKKVIWVSQEMTADEVCGRLVLMRSKVPTAEREDYDPEDKQKIQAAMFQLRGQPLTILDRPVTPERLWAMSRCWRAVEKLDLLGIDYLQILQLQRGDKEHQVIGDAVMLLKRLAMELQIPVLCLAQCRREGMTQRRRVYMSDFKGSGAIEEHSDAVLLLWPGDRFNQLSCDLAKNRRGRTGTFELQADFDTMTFTSVTPAVHAPVFGADNRGGE
jgi:replicative DNA helicase